MSPKAIITVEKIDHLLRVIQDGLMDLTERANKNRTYFWADCTVSYGQEYDIDSDKGLDGKIGASAPAFGAAGVDASAEAKAKFGVQKSREGTVEISQVSRFRSEVALASIKAIRTRDAAALTPTAQQ